MDLISMATAVAAADGVAPLDEATLLTLQNHPERITSWGDHRGFGLLVDQGESHELSIVVMPHERGVGYGKRLLRQHPLPEGRITAWSHGDHPAAAALAERHGFTKVRDLWVMRRAAEGLPAPRPVPDGVTVRGFRPDDPHDTAELLRVNAAAFAHHPEQGALDEDGLAERTSQPWFDPEGLLLAVEGDRLLGFHWTKRHDADEGEVYVVGIDPAAQGRGLGSLLTLAGLHHLADTGVSRIHLYVEADNAPAVAVYEKLGFTRAQADTHVQYARG